MYCGKLYLQETSVHVKNTTDILRMALINTKFTPSLIIKHKKLQSLPFYYDSLPDWRWQLCRGFPIVAQKAKEVLMLGGLEEGVKGCSESRSTKVPL